MDDWPDLIGFAVQMRQRLNAYDPVVVPATIPHLGATEQQLAEAEERLGHPLDPLHSEMLSYANGWEDFVHLTDLYGTDEIGKGERWETSLEQLQLRYFPYEGATRLEDGEPDPEELYIIAGKPDEGSAHQFLLWKTGPISLKGGHPVIWQAGYEIERYPDVHDLLLSLNQYLQEDIAEMENGEQL